MDLMSTASCPADVSSPIGSLWERTATAPPATKQLDVSLATDVAVIGGGYSGLSTALHLAEKGIRTVLLEAQTIGFGASGRNGGQINPGFKLDPADAHARLGFDGAERCLNFAGSAPDIVFDLITRHRIDCDAQRAGWLQPAHNAAAIGKLARRVDEWSIRGVAMRMLDRNETVAMLGSTVYPGAAFDPRGGSVQPLSYARGLAKAAIAAGAAIYENAPVNTLRREGNRWSVQLRQHHVTADRVVVTTNGYTTDLVPRLRQTIIAANSFQIATEPLSHELAATILPQGQTASDSRRIVLYFRKDRDNRVVIGGRGKFEDPRSPGEFGHLRNALVHTFPQLQGTPIEFRWAGRVALTQDGLPHLHEPAPGLLIGLGCNGRGIAMSTAMGRAFAQHLSGIPDVLPFPVKRIRPIPFHRLQRMYLGAAIHWFMLRDAL
jgi:glycine/D-amino acid oxidase-like deaminating enzyme